MDAVIKEVKMGMAKRGVRFMEDGREWRIGPEGDVGTVSWGV